SLLSFREIAGMRLRNGHVGILAVSDVHLEGALSVALNALEARDGCTDREGSAASRPDVLFINGARRSAGVSRVSHDSATRTRRRQRDVRRTNELGDELIRADRDLCGRRIAHGSKTVSIVGSVKVGAA